MKVLPFIFALFCSVILTDVRGKEPDKSDVVAQLFAEDLSREIFQVAVGKAMAEAVPMQIIAEAKLSYGLKSGDHDYLKRNLPNFEKALLYYDQALAVKLSSKEQFQERIEYIKELLAHPAPQQSAAAVPQPSEGSPSQLAELEAKLSEYQKMLIELDKSFATQVPPATTPVSKQNMGKYSRMVDYYNTVQQLKRDQFEQERRQRYLADRAVLLQQIERLRSQVEALKAAP